MVTSKPITAALANGLALPPGKTKLIINDAPDTPPKAGAAAFVPGFGIRVTPGAKTFVFRYRSDGIDRTMRIGALGPWTVVAARERARELRRQVDGGADPQRLRADAEKAATLKDLWDRYLKGYTTTLRKRTVEAYTATFDNLIKPALGKMKVGKIQHDDVVQLHAKVTRDNGPYSANRVVALLSALFGVAIRLRLLTENPAKGVHRNVEQPRKKYLTEDEAKRLLEAIKKLRHPQSANAIRLLLLTGARKGETLAAKWTDIDIKNGVWTKPGATTKQRTTHRVVLSSSACALLADMHKNRTSQVWVFPGGDDEDKTHQRDLKAAWRSIQKTANLPHIRIHDLRHSFASFLVSSGASLPMIGSLLGHTQAQTTARYAHLFESAQKEAADSVGNLIDGIAAGKKADVVPLKRISNE